MDSTVKTSLGILIVLVLVYADPGKSNINFNERCQVRNQNTLINFVINDFRMFSRLLNVIHRQKSVV